MTDRILPDVTFTIEGGLAPRRYTGPRLPTGDECNNHSPIEYGGRVAFACWYPQMGGYGGKCVVVSCANQNDGESPAEACFDIYVWHDGEFPFAPDSDIEHLGYAREPTQLHHCSAEQFIRFGETVRKCLAKKEAA